MREQPPSKIKDDDKILSMNRRPFLQLTGAAGGSTLLSTGVGAAADDDKEDQEESDGPTVHIMATGGTIANPPDEGYYTAEELVEARPELEDIASVSVTGVSQLGSSSLTAQVLYDLHENIMEVAEGEDPPNGFVVTVGSNATEEVAYFLNLVLDTDIPVTVTGAQRPPEAPGTDSDKNLYDAARVAISPDAEGRGVLIVVNDEIHHARDGSKLVTRRPDAWKSPNFGRVGIVEDGVHFYRSTDRLSTTDTEFDISGTDPEDLGLPDIKIVYSAIESDGELVDAAVDAGAKGIIVESYPTGSASSPDSVRSQEKALENAAEKGVPVVYSHRGVEGRITPEDVGELFIAGDTLRPHKAMLLLALGLMETSDRNKLQEIFDTY